MALQCCAGVLTSGVTDPTLVPLGVAAGGFDDMLLGEQKFPAGLMVQASVDPQSASAHWNRALARLAAGDFERGWAEYEWRWRRPQTPPRPFRQPAWDGAPLEGRTILLWMEQGLGDMLQFIRYVGEGRGVRGEGARLLSNALLS